MRLGHPFRASCLRAFCPTLRFYLTEPVDRGRTFLSLIKLTLVLLLISFASLLAYIAVDVAPYLSPATPPPASNWPRSVTGMTFYAIANITLLLLAGALVYLLFWIPLWWLTTLGRRLRCRGILKARGWPTCPLSPRLLRFSDETWRRLPPWEHFAPTGWFDQWHGGQVRPLNLYATLVLLEEIRFGYADGDWRTVRRIEIVARDTTGRRGRERSAAVT